MQKRPKLSKAIKFFVFKYFYWTKDELRTFCQENKIPTQGDKMELSARIEYDLLFPG